MTDDRPLALLHPPKIPLAEEIDLDGTTLLVLGGTRREEFGGKWLPADLASECVERWVEHFECDHCGRVDYCKFPQPSPYHQDRHLDIKCGVASTATREFVTRTSGLMLGRSVPDKQAYLDAAYHYCRYVMETETRVGSLLEPNMLDHFESEDASYAPLVLAQIVTPRRRLNKIAHLLARFPRFKTTASLVLVEGATEKAFLDALGESGLVAFTSYEYESYDGKSNARPARLDALIRDRQRRGYSVWVQGDDDGKPRGGVRALVAERAIPLGEEHIFAFEWDFETSWPLRVLWVALDKLETPALPAEPDEFIATIAARGPPVVRALKQTYGIEPNKVELGRVLGRVVTSFDFWRHPLMEGSEALRFLEWLHRL